MNLSFLEKLSSVAFLVLASAALGYFGPPLEAEIRKVSLKEEALITDYSVRHRLLLEEDIELEVAKVDVPEKYPFPWCEKAAKKLRIDEEGLDARAAEAFELYKKAAGGSGSIEKITGSGLKDDALLYARSVLDLLQRKGDMDDDQLLEELKKEYRFSAYIFLAKVEGQKPIANPHKMPPAYYERVQPWIASLMYGNRYFALAELYRSSKVFEGNKDKYLGIYLQEPIIRRTARVQTRLQDMAINLASLDREELADIVSVSVATMVGKQMYRLNEEEKVMEKKKL